MKRLLLIVSVVMILAAGSAAGQLPAWNRYKENRSLTYDSVMAVYNGFIDEFPGTRLFTAGPTDVGKPLHLFVISSDGDFDPVSVKRKGKAVLFINNGIHPGEPDGIDASAWFAYDLLSNRRYDSLLAKVVVCIIPVYNIDGALQRGCCSRANQDGPEAYGFRGNARNLDLNRDFIKADASNTLSFSELFRKWDPDVFIDTHVSDGADYQYVMTLIATQHNKMEPVAGAYLKKQLTPAIYKEMKKRGHEMCPYVNTRGETPESDIIGFYEPPRFATGYAALYHTFGFVSESHMLKPFPQRVEATHALLFTLLNTTASNARTIIDVRKKAKEACAVKTYFPIRWKPDTAVFETISFKGYEARNRPSSVTGKDRLYYDRSKPFERPVKFYDFYYVSDSVRRPSSYILPQAWREVISRLKANDVTLIPMERDTVMEVMCYVIDGYDSGNRPYEGHFVHRNTKVHTEKRTIRFFKGDYLIPLNQPAVRYLVEALEPSGDDSFFAWGFFDSVLQQKEYFSDYVFEDRAEELLQHHPELREAFNKQKSSDPKFAADARAMLEYIYNHSPSHETTHNLYPVYRVE